MKVSSNSEKYSQLVDRLPITFRPFINEKLASMDRLFPFERNSFETFLSFIEKLTPSEFESLFKPMKAIEAKMGAAQWKFSRQGETLENTSLLAHSPYYREWRDAVQGVFDQVTAQTSSSTQQSAGTSKHRLVVIVLPRSLPVKPETVWSEWSGQGRQLTLAHFDSSQASCSEILLGPKGGGLAKDAASESVNAPEEVWILDADSELGKFLPVHETRRDGAQASTYLGYTELLSFREAFRDRLNWIQKDLADADKVIAELRQTDVTPWCPDALKSQIATREFVKELFLSGNGSVVFGNAFVQWAASEAFRRARPSVLVACFDVRNKPKAFTSIAILEDQEHTSPLPDVPDPEGSAVDAQILARYVWLGASRYDEYKDALCLCVADAIPAIYAITPAGHSLFNDSEPMTLERIGQVMREWMT